MAQESAGERALAAASQLEKIGFVDFTVHLVQGVYEVIVKASMDQLKSYADFVNMISKSLVQYQDDLIGADGSTKQVTAADSYIKDVLALDPLSTADYTLTSDQVTSLKQHFSEVTIEDTTTTTTTKKQIGDHITSSGTTNILKVAELKKFVTEKLKSGAKHSYNLITTILKIGMQKVVVTNGEIETKLTFHIDASDTLSKDAQSMNSKSSGWGIGGGVSAAGGGIVGKIIGGTVGGSISGGYSSRKLNVSVVNEKSSSATNINIDILGAVKIQFRTETFPTVNA